MYIHILNIQNDAVVFEMKVILKYKNVTVIPDLILFERGEKNADF